MGSEEIELGDRVSYKQFGRTSVYIVTRLYNGKYNRYCDLSDTISRLPLSKVKCDDLKMIMKHHIVTDIYGNIIETVGKNGLSKNDFIYASKIRF